MIDKILVARIKHDIDNIQKGFETSEQNKYDLAIMSIKDSVITMLNKGINAITGQKTEVQNITEQDKEKIINYVEKDINKMYFSETMVFLGLTEKALIKVFADELKDYNEINQSSISEIIIEDMTQKLYFEAIKEENKSLWYDEISFIEDLKREYKEVKKLFSQGKKIKYVGNYYSKASDYIKDYIFNRIRDNIEIKLNVYFNFKIDNVFNLSVEEYEKLKEVLNSEDISNHYILNCLNSKIHGLEFLDDHILKSVIDEMIEELYYKIIGATDQQQGIYQAFIREILKSYEEIDNDTIEQIKENVETLLNFKKLPKVNII